MYPGRAAVLCPAAIQGKRVPIPDSRAAAKLSKEGDKILAGAAVIKRYRATLQARS
jgi:hypothetical protein